MYSFVLFLLLSVLFLLHVLFFVLFLLLIVSLFFEFCFGCVYFVFVALWFCLSVLFFLHVFFVFVSASECFVLFCCVYCFFVVLFVLFCIFQLKQSSRKNGKTLLETTQQHPSNYPENHRKHLAMSLQLLRTKLLFYSENVKQFIFIFLNQVSGLKNPLQSN